MVLIRPAEEKDLSQLYVLATHLDSMNLPRDRHVLRTLIRVSQVSFAGRLPDKKRGKYLFVAEETQHGKVIGCAAIFAQHGTRERPHLYFQICRDNRHSRLLQKSFPHKYVVLKHTAQGPTELCTLVVLPRYRRRPEKIGLQLSFARFLYIWRHPKKFKRRFLSELNGVIRPDGGNDLWDALGRKLTGLDYRTADHMSATSKEFILSLYPRTKIYKALLPEKAQKVLEQTSPHSRGALHLLKKIGFRYLQQCCPFDGGPHYGARFSQIKLFRHVYSGQAKACSQVALKRNGLVLMERGKNFLIGRTFFTKNGRDLIFDPAWMKQMKLSQQDSVAAMEIPR